MNEQWISSIESCSYRSQFPDSISRKTGVEKLCQATDSADGWVFLNDNREEVLAVSFHNPVFINEICIYENLNPGSVIRLEIFESPRNQWWTMWQRKSPTQQLQINQQIFRPILRRYHFRSNMIRVTFDPRYADRIGIQAIKLIGSTEFIRNFQAFPQALLKLHEQISDPTKTDVQFLVENQLINAHKNILCCRCPYFRALLLGDFHEKHENKPIELTEIALETFLEVLFFIYTGIYHSTISYDLAINCLIYCDRINFLSGKDGALEKIYHFIRADHRLVLSVYCLIKRISPALDHLLDHIYQLVAEYLDEICQDEVFKDLDKDMIIDLLQQSSQRRQREKKSPT